MCHTHQQTILTLASDIQTAAVLAHAWRARPCTGSEA